MTHKYFKLLFALVLIGGCTKNDNPISADSLNNLYPLKIGYSRSYHFEAYDSEGKTLEAYDYSIKIIGDTLIDSTKWFISYRNKALNFSDSISFFTNKTEGVYMHSQSWVYTGNPMLYYKYPKQSHETFTRKYYNDVVSTVEMTIIDQNTVQYKTILGGDENYDYLQNGIGLIKNELYHTSNTGKRFLGWRLQLTSSNLN